MFIVKTIIGFRLKDMKGKTVRIAKIGVIEVEEIMMTAIKLETKQKRKMYWSVSKFLL